MRTNFDSAGDMCKYQVVSMVCRILLCYVVEKRRKATIVLLRRIQAEGNTLALFTMFPEQDLRLTDIRVSVLVIH